MIEYNQFLRDTFEAEKFKYLTSLDAALFQELETIEIIEVNYANMAHYLLRLTIKFKIKENTFPLDACYNLAGEAYTLLIRENGREHSILNKGHLYFSKSERSIDYQDQMTVVQGFLMQIFDFVYSKIYK